MTFTIERLITDVRQTLTPERLRHVEGVVSIASELALANDVSADKAVVAAWLHDFAREWPPGKLAETAAKLAIPEDYFDFPALLHGPIAAAIGRQTYGIVDDEILAAVSCHTTGRPKMSPLDLVLFVADAIEPGRHYSGVEEIRNSAVQSLMLASRQSIDQTFLFLLECGRPLFPLTVLTRNWLLKNTI